MSGNIKLVLLNTTNLLKILKLKAPLINTTNLIETFFNQVNIKDLKVFFNSIIIVCEYLDYDTKINFLEHCTKAQKHNLQKIINCNNVNWFKSSENELLKQIKI